MKVLIECFIPTESGPVFSLGFAKALEHNGVEVYSILHTNIDNRDRWEDNFDKNKICFVEENISFKNNLLKSIKQLLLIRQFFKGISFDYAIDTFPNGLSYKINHVLNYHTSLGILHDVIPHSSTLESGTNVVINAVSKLDGIIILSKLYKDIVINRYPKINQVLYLRHGAMEYPVLSSQEAYNDKFDINFLYFGRIDGYKGLHVLSEAYSNIVKKHENISLTVAGGGDFSEYENEYAILPNCTVVNKYLTDDDIAYYFSKPNTVIVLPYLDATQSGVIGMAFNYRTPVIVSDTGGLKEQLFDGEMGLFVEPGNAQDLEDKMEEFILNKELYEEQKEKMDSGYKKSTWDYVTKEFLAQLKGNK